MVGNQRLERPAPRDPNKRMGFQGAENKEVVATRGVKLRNKEAEEAEKQQQAREEYKQRFEQRAEQTLQYHNERDSRAVSVVSKFLVMMKDKTLQENRGVIAEDVEKEIRQDLISLALDLNNDETEPDNGKGSVVALTAVLKVLLMYRDRINKMEYDAILMRKEIDELKSGSSKAGKEPYNAGQ